MAVSRRYQARGHALSLLGFKTRWEGTYRLAGGKDAAFELRGGLYERVRSVFVSALGNGRSFSPPSGKGISPPVVFLARRASACTIWLLLLLLPVYPILFAVQSE